MNIKELFDKAHSAVDNLGLNILALLIFLGGYIGLLRLIGDTSELSKIITCYAIVSLPLLVVFILFKKGILNKRHLKKAVMFIILYMLLAALRHYLRKTV